jgi:VanZ family protein
MAKFFKQKDKKLHISLSAIIAIGLYFLIKTFTELDTGVAIVFVFVATLFIGIFKEVVHDGVAGKGTVDAKDILADALGSAIGLVLSYFIL